MQKSSEENLKEDIRHFLEQPCYFSVLGLERGKAYKRSHDDYQMVKDETVSGNIIVAIGENDDAFVRVELNRDRASLRFSSELGQGKSLRVRNALIILALAIKLDNSEVNYCSTGTPADYKDKV